MKRAIRFINGLGVLLSLLAASAYASSWAPINPDELKMTSEPKAPGASAIILELQMDGVGDTESVYKRIKVLTDSGRKYANVEIPYNKEMNESVRDIEARTVRPDGTVLDFDSKIFDKLIVKGRGIRYQAKTFSLPEVEVGSIIEYKYVKYSLWGNSARWVLSEELFIKHAKYSLVPFRSEPLGLSWPRGLPPGTANPVPEKNGTIHLETRDVPAFVAEEYMPPESELKYRVNFVHNTLWSKDTSPAQFWEATDKLWYKGSEKFMDEKKAMEKVVSQLIQPTDTAEQKLRKIYVHVQALRNLTYEVRKTIKEQMRDETKAIENVNDIEKYGYGYAGQLTYLYVALARAAGFQADIAYISSRNLYFFDPDVFNSWQLNSVVVVVTLDSKDVYLEPGIPFVPYAILPWYQSGVSGLRLSKEGGSWIKIPLTNAQQTKVVRRAEFKLVDSALEGTITVTYTGLNAIYYRTKGMHDDDAARKEYMENELKRVIVTGADVTMTNQPDWSGVETPLVVEYKVKIRGWASSAGKLLLMPIGLFGADEKHTFEQEKRVYPIYFHYPEITEDDINIDLPSGWQVASMPKPHGENIEITEFASNVENTNNAIQIKRKLAIDGIYLPQKYYPALREFYQNVRANDEEQIVLTPVSAGVANKDQKSH